MVLKYGNVWCHATKTIGLPPPQYLPKCPPLFLSINDAHLYIVCSHNWDSWDLGDIFQDKVSVLWPLWPINILGTIFNHCILYILYILGTKRFSFKYRTWSVCFPLNLIMIGRIRIWSAQIPIFDRETFWKPSSQNAEISQITLTFQRGSASVLNK